jgi:hypothetical protein
MFGWFWEFLYMISKTIFRIIDGLILCANKLCGIDTVNFDGEDTDFLTYLMFSDEISFAFRVSALLATMLLVVFTVFMIIRTIAKDKAEGTPTQIAVKTFKTLLMFFLVPMIIYAFMTLGNAFVKALYSATVQSSASPGTFLFCAFADDGGMKAEFVERFRIGELDYYSTSTVSSHMILSDFPFLFSWIAGGVVLFGVGSAMLIFVDRVLSLVILYLAAPISISTSLIDEGARFKLWRDQFLSKFIMGYGMILAINIYALVCGLVMKPGFEFFPGEDDKFLDLIMKLLIIAGGALTMQKSMAVIGNLVSAGAGSNELRDNALSMGKLASMAGGAAMFAGKTAGKALGVVASPLKIPGSILSNAASQWSKEKGSQLLDWLGWGYKGKGESGAKNDSKAKYGNDDKAKGAISADDGFKQSWDTPNNDNNNKTGDNKNNPVTEAIQGGGNNGNNNNNQNDQQQQQQHQQQQNPQGNNQGGN